MNKPRYSVRGRVAHSADQRLSGIRWCWHIYRGDADFYCGIDWFTTVDIARALARSEVEGLPR